MTKLPAISVPAMLKVHILCARKADQPGRSREQRSDRRPHAQQDQTDGSAQQISVLNELKREK